MNAPPTTIHMFFKSGESQQRSFCLSHIQMRKKRDQFQREFNTIVTLAEALVETSGIPSFSFLFHLGILSPLLLTSIRRRDPIIRRRAVHILSSSHRCVGIWDSRLAATVAGHVIDVKEKDVWQNAPGVETCHIRNFSLGNIQAYVRVKEVLVRGVVKTSVKNE
ncbi:hypothetical protein BDZ45DRAFT_801820 [Acephala macrosclerotiorum]|nr:hypothetical protein BDZ45DRAFT_801820 [Acephala macrosclerotiorum]